MKGEKFIVGRYVWAINLFFITIAAFVIADITNLFLGKKMEIPFKPSFYTTLERIEKPQQEANYPSMMILERNIFNSRPKVMINEQPSTVETDLKVKLIGTVVGGTGFSYAIVEDQTNKEQTLYRLNDIIAGDAQIVKISRNELVLLRNGKKEILHLYMEELQDSEKTRSEKLKVQTSLDNRYILDKREVAAAMENIPRLLTQARIIPNFTGSQAEGFKVINIAQNSFYEKIGLKNGDVLHKINGIDINEPENFLKVFQQLKDENNITLDLIRGGSKMTFKYEMR